MVFQYLNIKINLQFVAHIGHYLTVEQAYGARSELRIVLRVCNHYYSSAFAVEFLEQQHNLLAVL